MRILNHKDFLVYSELIKESILYISPKLRRRLSEIESPVSKKLLDSLSKDLKGDTTFIDFDEEGKEGWLSFKTMKNTQKTLLDRGIQLNLDSQYSPILSDNLFDSGSEIVKKSRIPVRIGRMINSLFPGEFSNKEIEEFINKFKSTQKKELVEIVEGPKISFWYDVENYFEEKYTLGSSCMRESSPSWFDIYVKNPEVCKMAIITEINEEGEKKLVARALLWKPSEKENLDFEWFLDRQYATEDSYVEVLRNWAVKMGYAYKAKNNHHSLKEIVFDKQQYSVNMEVNLKKIKYYSFPYVDTFRRFNPEESTLYNDDDEIGGNYLLDNTEGGYSEVETGVYSDYYDTRIPESDAVWSRYLDTYLYRETSREITLGNMLYRGWWPEEHDDIVIERNGNWIHANDAVYSEWYDDVIISDDAQESITELDFYGNITTDTTDIEDNSFMTFFKFMKEPWYKKINEIKGWEDEASSIWREILVEHPKLGLIPKEFIIKLYKKKDSEVSNLYNTKNINEPVLFTKIDALALGIDLDTDIVFEANRISYNMMLEKNNLSAKILKGLNDLEFYDSRGKFKQLSLEFGNEENLKEWKKKEIRERISELKSYV